MTHEIPKVIYTAFLDKQPIPERIAALEVAWRTLNPEWGFRCITLDRRPPVINYAEWGQSFLLPEPAGRTARLNLLRYEILAREGGVFIDDNCWPLRPLDDLLENVTGFCTTVPGGLTPHALSPSVMGCIRNHAAMWHCVRDLPHSVVVYRGIWDQSGGGFLTRVIRDHGHFRQFVPFHWSLFGQPKDLATAAAAFGYVAADTPALPATEAA